MLRAPPLSLLPPALCKRTFKSHVIVFVRAKKSTHRLRIIFGLAGLNAVELHGDLNQRDVWHLPPPTHTHTVFFSRPAGLVSSCL